MKKKRHNRVGSLNHENDSSQISIYKKFWGERWIGLRSSLLSPSRKVARPNFFSELKSQSEKDFWQKGVLGGGGTAPIRDDKGLLDKYWMDPASLIPPLQLLALTASSRVDFKEDEMAVVDLCAAPGGKSLVLIESGIQMGLKMNPIYLNELSPSRFGRLQQTLNDYLPKDIVQRLHFHRTDASRWGLDKTDQIDLVLLDAPCSGERFLLAETDAEGFGNAELPNWNQKRSKRLAIEQYAMLANGFRVLRPGGILVFSTCSVSPLEGDEIIEKLLSRAEKRGLGCPEVKKMDFELQNRVSDFGLELESSKFGYYILPDRSQMAGPIFFATIRKAVV